MFDRQEPDRVSSSGERISSVVEAFGQFRPLVPNSFRGVLVESAELAARVEETGYLEPGIFERLAEGRGDVLDVLAYTLSRQAETIRQNMDVVDPPNIRFKMLVA